MTTTTGAIPIIGEEPHLRLVDASARGAVQEPHPATVPIRIPTRHRDEGPLARLTPREVDVFYAIAEGMTNAEIARAFTVSLTTVKTHVARILLKLDARDRVQLVVLAYRSGLMA